MGEKKNFYICCPLIKITSGNLKSGVNFGKMLIYEDEKRENEISLPFNYFFCDLFQ